MNGGQVDWRELFLNSAGRVSRAPFLIAAAILISLAAIYEGVVNPVVHWVTGLVVYPVLLYCGASVLAKRLHDRGRSGWWAALVLFALMVVWPHPHGFFGLAFAIVLVWSAIELGLMPGEQGSNRYGPSPLKAATA
jgi:uncharacterized membrane protein YhaH (DUF805 family)